MGKSYGWTSSKNYNKKSYGSSYYNYGNNYSWGGSWNSWSSESTSSSERYLCVKEHENYNTPLRNEIESKFSQIYNYPFKGTFYDVEKIQDDCRFFFYRMIDEKDYLKEPSQVNYGSYMMDAKKEKYTQLWETETPGYTPLEMALSIYAANMKEQKAGKQLTRKDIEDASKGQEGDGSGDGEAAGIMENLENEGSTKFSEDWWDPEFNELFNGKFKNKKLKVLNQISLLKELGAKFEVEKEVSERITYNSDIFKKKILRDYSQIHLVDNYQRVLPTFKVKLAIKDLIINAPIDKKENKQKIIILLDFSGSMSYQEKQDWVITILADRLKYVMKEEAEIFFSYYCYYPSELKFHHLTNKADVLKFWSSFSTSPNGGDTNIGAIVDHIKKEIEENKKLHNLNIDLSKEKPEILVIHDGQDTVKTQDFGYKTNAITMMDGVNKDLKKVCIKSEGVYVYIPPGDISKVNPIKAFEGELERSLVV